MAAILFSYISWAGEHASEALDVGIRGILRDVLWCIDIRLG